MFKKAFTIIEIAIVLVILGLVSLGVSSASSMYQEMQIKSMIFDVRDVGMAYNNFKGQYNQVPGDMSVAAAYWSDCAETNSNCNGNGNGVIDVGNTAANDEIIKAWKHLSKSGYFSFTSAPIPDSHDGTIIPGQNAPAANLDGIGYFIGGGRLISSSGGAQPPFLDVVNTIYMGCAAPLGTHDPLIGGGLTPETAFAIDRKIDDGYADELGNWLGAATGTIRALDGVMFNTGDCFSGNAYNKAATSKTCVSGSAINYVTNSSDGYNAPQAAAVDEGGGEEGGGEEMAFPGWMPQWMNNLFAAEGGWPDWIPQWMVDLIANDGVPPPA